jgi:hypothetical protein
LGEEEEETMTLSAEEYTEYVLNRAGFKPRLVGYARREENPNLERPAYQFTVHGDVNGAVGHSISYAYDVRIEKRQEPACQRSNSPR